MNCPNCGSPKTADQQFCRSCGAGFTSDEPRRFNPRVWGLVTLMLVFGGLLMAMSGKLLDLRWLTFTGVFVMIGGMFFIAAFALMRETRPRKRKAVLLPQSKTLVPADTTNKLQLPVGMNDFVPSVIDNTTELLKEPAPSHTKSGL